MLASMPSKVSLLAVGGVGVRQMKLVTDAQPKKALEPMVSMLRSMKISSRAFREAEQSIEHTPSI